MKNVLITGASGFIGRNLAEGLCKTHNVFAPRHSELELLDGDAVARYVRDNRIDVIVHAAIHVPQVNGAEHECSNDLRMFLNLERVSDRVEKLLYFGSGAEYDKRSDIRRVTEEDLGARVPVSEYGLAKYAMTKLARASANVYNLRLFGVFGKYELWQSKFLSNLCCKAAFGFPLTVRKQCRFNFLYIDDLVRITERFLSHAPAFHDYNVCHDRDYDLTELAELVVRVSGKPLEIRLLSEGRNPEYTASCRRLCAELPELTFTPMERSLAALYRYYEANKARIDPEVLKNTR